MARLHEDKQYGIKIRESADDGSDFTNPEADYRIVFLGEDGQWHAKDSAGTVTALGGAAGEITDLPTAEMDDSLVLAPDGAGGVEFRAEAGGGGISSGTAFPGSPSTGDLFHRTDLSVALWRYDGTRWLSASQLEVGIGGQQTLLPATVDSAIMRFPVRQDYGIYLDRIAVVTFVTTTNSGAHFWTIAISRRNGANANSAIASFTTAADSPNNWVNHDQAVGSVLDSSAREIQVQATPSGSPGSVYLPMSLVYRLIAT